MYAKQRTLLIVLGVEAVVCLVISAINYNYLSYLSIITFPFEQIAMGLRALSLSGSLGNALALLIYICVGALPVAYMIFRMVKKKGRLEDIMLLVLSIMLFVALHLLINPKNISVQFGIIGAGKGALSGTIYSVIIGYVFLRLLRKHKQSGTSTLLKQLKAILALICFFIVFELFGWGIVRLISSIQTVNEGNTGFNSAVPTTHILLVIRYIINAVPYFLSLAILINAHKLLTELNDDRYGEGVVVSARKLETLCARAVVITVLCGIVVNLIQLLAGSNLLSSEFNTQIPLIPLALVLMVMLFSRYFAESRKIKHDNDMFI